MKKKINLKTELRNSKCKYIVKMVKKKLQLKINKKHQIKWEKINSLSTFIQY